jgi:hypothetical protein
VPKKKSRNKKKWKPAPFRPEHWLVLADVASHLNPQDALVVVPIDDANETECLTYPLPARDDALSCQVIAALVAAEFARRPEVGWVFLATFCDSERSRPHESLQFAVMMRLHQDGIHLTGSFYVSAAGWGSYTCDDPECLGPRHPRELEEGAAYLHSGAQRAY